MYLDELISWLKEQDQEKVIKHGFGEPHVCGTITWDIAFEPIENTTIGSMLEMANKALAMGTIKSTYRGNELDVTESSKCWIDKPEYKTWEEIYHPTCIGQTLLNYWSN